eukprot:gb/GFBE01006308.1/.p1 GENE.gb/GFBE01006308.1/~~gb/GFBE01006308.1/.p1  ORF type:complete len:579 (+),score=130.95 gb/GFBE01006308.1/:1-1737(+)
MAAALLLVALPFLVDADGHLAECSSSQDEVTQLLQRRTELHEATTADTSDSFAAPRQRVSLADLGHLTRLTGSDDQCLKFLHIPKTGGTSIEKVAKPAQSWGAAGQADMHCAAEEPCVGRTGDKCCHISDSDQQCSIWHVPPAVDTVRAESYASTCQTFCVVRDPVDRFVSEFKFARKFEDHVDECDSKAFLSWAVHQLDEVKKNPYTRDCHFLPQVDYVYGSSDRGGIPGTYCTRVLRTSNLTMEFNELMDEFGVPVELEDTHEFGTSDCEIQVPNDIVKQIESIYAEDLSAFGFAPRPADVLPEDSAVRSFSSKAEQELKSIAVVAACYPDPTPYALSSGDEDAAKPWQEICAAARRNFQRYCDYHGYQLFFHEETLAGDRPNTWHKVTAIKDALTQDGVEHVFWMDADSLFMNFDRPLELLVPAQDKHLTFSGDKLCFLNAGHLMFSKSNWTLALLDELWDVYPPPAPWDEQSSLIYLLSAKEPDCRTDSSACCRHQPLAECDVRPSVEMNSYTEDFKPGDFIIHFAGIRASDKAAWMGEYDQKVILAGAGQESLSLLHATAKGKMKFIQQSGRM